MNFLLNVLHPFKFITSMKHATDSACLGPDLLLSCHEYGIGMILYLGSIDRPIKTIKEY